MPARVLLLRSRRPFIIARPLNGTLRLGVIPTVAPYLLPRRKRVKECDLDDEHCLRDQALAVCARNGAREVDDFRATSLATLVQMVCGGVGMTLLPELAAKVEAKAEGRLTLIPFGGKKPSRTIGQAWRSSSLRGPEFELFGQAVRSALGEAL